MMPAMRTSTSTLALVLTLTSALATACSKGQDAGVDPPEVKNCTAIGCLNGFHLDLDHQGPWAPGAYAFEITADGAQVTCTGALPLQGCDAGPTLRCDVDERVVIGESGCALAADQQGFADIHFNGEPAEVSVTLRRDGEVIGEYAGSPSYTESRPNGPECEPVCHQANARVPVK